MTHDQPMRIREGWRGAPSVYRVVVMAAVGIVAGVITSFTYRWQYAPLVGWGAAAVTFEIWAWRSIGGMNADETRRHATREDPSRPVSDLMVLLANVASLAAVAYVIVESGNAQGATRGWLAALALASVAVSWVLVQTLYTLHYARLYYTGSPGGVDFNTEEPPSYVDFAYVAFTMGMTYQVSDTNLQTRDFRLAVLRQGLLSYVFGSVILATTINLVVGLSG